MQFREWTKEDLPTILSLERECFSDPWTENMLQGEFDRFGFYGVLAEVEGQVIGYACSAVLFESAELPKIAVLTAYRGQGIGGKLLDFLCEQVKMRGAEELFLEVRASNTPAIGLYQSRGFQQTRLRKKYYANGEDGLEMKKEL